MDTINDTSRTKRIEKVRREWREGSKMIEFISESYLRKYPNDVFVFGDNTIRIGKKGAAILRDEPNTYGFITQKYPSSRDFAHYRVNEYKQIFINEMEKLKSTIASNPDKTYLISKLGSGLANRFGIWEKIVREGLKELKQYSNIRFLYD